MRRNMHLPLIFWDVDTQVDFLSSRGRLYVPGAETIVPNLKRLTTWAGRNNVLVIASACAHMPGDKEFQIYPPHCLAGTPGQAKVPETSLDLQVVIPNRRIDLPAWTGKQQIVIEKQAFDVFSNPNTETLLLQLQPREIVLYGVVTEICVAAAAYGLLKRGYSISLVTDAIYHLDQASASEFIREAQRRGGRLLTTDEAARKRAA
jgi:nicotinamidase/pyrazinamidase